MELNELVVDKNQEMHWRETARWIKFEEDVEEDTARWGKPHVASLSFRSLLELRKTIAHGESGTALCRQPGFVHCSGTGCAGQLLLPLTEDMPAVSLSMLLVGCGETDSPAPHFPG